MLRIHGSACRQGQDRFPANAHHGWAPDSEFGTASAVVRDCVGNVHTRALLIQRDRELSLQVSSRRSVFNRAGEVNRLTSLADRLGTIVGKIGACDLGPCPQTMSAVETKIVPAGQPRFVR